MEKEILRQLIGKLIIKACLGLKYLSDIKAKLAKYQSKIEYRNIIKTDLKFENLNALMGYAHGDVFISQLKIAVEKKVPVKCCFLCKYRGDNYNYTEGLSIYCKLKKLHVIQIGQRNISV